MVTKSYELEYGKNSLSIQKDCIDKFDSFVIVDDLLATGGTVFCVSDIITKFSKKITGLSVVVELSELNAKAKLPFNVDSQICF